jgi:hypothetical protein
MKYIYTLLFAAISTTCFAQGNLQFNKVVNVSGLTPGGNVFTTVSVPVGKVWKITSSSWMDSFGNIPNTSSSNILAFCIGPYMLKGGLVIGFPGSTLDPVTFPIWLDEGDYDVKFCSNTLTISNYTYAFSGIEFNIIP